MNENNEPNSSKELKETNEKQTNDLVSLTDRNWLFINAFLQTGSVLKSYEIAGYKGQNQSAPYQLFKQLKSRIEQLGDLDVTSRARLQSDLKQVLDLPLARDKKEVTLKEWLAIRKFSASITPEATQAKPQISFLVINRSGEKKQTVDDLDKVDTANGQDAITTPLDSPEIINVTPITEQ